MIKICPQKVLLPYLSFKKSLRSTTLLFPRMTFFYKKFAGKISSPKESKTWSPKFPPEKICFKKKLLPILPPPPPTHTQKKQLVFRSKEFAPQIFPPQNCCQTVLLVILLLTNNCFPNFAPQKSLLPGVVGWCDGAG